MVYVTAAFMCNNISLLELIPSMERWADKG